MFEDGPIDELYPFVAPVVGTASGASPKASAWSLNCETTNCTNREHPQTWLHRKGGPGAEGRGPAFLAVRFSVLLKGLNATRVL
jgi:hypothetical protein